MGLSGLSKFFQSDTEKIHLIVAQDEPGLYGFLDQLWSGLSRTEGCFPFHYEIWEGEHSKHFLFRWMYETIYGHAYRGRGDWKELLKSGPRLREQLILLMEKDIRPLEIRFLDLVRFLFRALGQDEKLILSVTPRTNFEDRALVDFFQELLRLLPTKVKMVIGQIEGDVVARQTDFSPSNRILLEATEGLEKVRESYAAVSGGATSASRVLNALATLVHPADETLLSVLLGMSSEEVGNALGAPELDALLQTGPDEGVRVAFPRTLAAEGKQEDREALLRKAVEILDKRISGEGSLYPALIHQALDLHRVEDGKFIAEYALSSYTHKVASGWNEVSELEMERALTLLPESDEALRAQLFMSIGETRESRMKSAEALAALDEAARLFLKLERPEELVKTLELKGRAAFAMRETDKAKEALSQSIELAAQLGKNELVADLTAQLAYVHFSLKNLGEAERLYKKALEIYGEISKVDKAAGESGVVRQWVNLGHTFYAEGDFPKSEEHHRKALEAYQASGDKQRQASQWGYLGHVLFAAGEYERAIDAYEKAGALEEEMGEPLKAAQRYASVGHALYAQRKVENAARSFQKALDAFRELGNAEGQAAQLSNLGMVKGDEGKYDEAVACFEQAAGLYKELGIKTNEISQITRIGHLRRVQGKFEDAENSFRQAVRLYHELEYPVGEAGAELDLGHLYMEMKDWEKAVGCIQRAKTSFRQMGNREQEAFCLSLLGQAQRGRGRIDEALAAWFEALEIYKKAENTLAVANVTSQVALLFYEQKRFGEAEKLYKEALVEFEKKEDVEGTANILSNLGTMYYETGRNDESAQVYERALDLLRKMEHPLGIAGVLQNLSFVYEKQERYGDAFGILKEVRGLLEAIQMEEEMREIEKRMAELEEKASGALDAARQELFPGLTSSKSEEDTETTGGKVGRNDPCPCGSGKKYKKCCGA